LECISQTKNAGFGRFHRKKTKKCWKHYFIEDYYDDGDWTFGSEWISAFKAILLKRKQVYKRKFICPECFNICVGFVKNDRTKVECPYCDE